MVAGLDSRGCHPPRNAPNQTLCQHSWNSPLCNRLSNFNSCKIPHAEVKKGKKNHFVTSEVLCGGGWGTTLESFSFPGTLEGDFHVVAVYRRFLSICNNFLYTVSPSCLELHGKVVGLEWAGQWGCPPGSIVNPCRGFFGLHVTCFVNKGTELNPLNLASRQSSKPDILLEELHRRHVGGGQRLTNPFFWVILCWIPLEMEWSLSICIPLYLELLEIAR